MFDPLGAFYRVRELYITYLETAFRISDQSVTDERRRLLETDGNLCTDPLLEPLARYRTVDWALTELPDRETGPLATFSKAERLAFTRLVSAGMFPFPNARLFEHQAEMLERGTQPGSPSCFM